MKKGRATLGERAKQALPQGLPPTLRPAGALETPGDEPTPSQWLCTSR